MHRFSGFVTITAAVVLGSAAAGHAKDWCLNLGGVTYLGKQVTIPPKGLTCVP